MLFTIPSKAYVPPELVALSQADEQNKIITNLLVLVVYSKYFIENITPLKEMNFLRGERK